MVMDVFIILIMMIVSQMYILPKFMKIVHFKYAVYSMSIMLKLKYLKDRIFTKQKKVERLSRQ